MRPLISAMTTMRNTVVAAIIRSLLRGKSLIQLFFAFCAGPTAFTAASQSKRSLPRRTIQDFLEEAEGLFVSPIRSTDELFKWSQGLKAQFRVGLATSEVSMLPSYNHQLPSGKELGQYLAIDMGGTTLRVALVELRGRDAPSGKQCEVVRVKRFNVDQSVKDLEGMAFFDWLAERILDTISTGLKGNHSPTRPIPMALAWSFPIEQTSLKGGKIHNMGKGLKASSGLLGQDLGEVIKFACRNKGLNVELEAIINDSAACLLSQSYSHLSTRFGLILGTGTNIGVFLPVSAIGRSKFGERPASWWEDASQVIVNTELGMYGKDVVPLTRWDKSLKLGHPKPDFQPMEHLVSGMYLGEVCRFTLLEAIESTGIFGGVVPPSLLTPYALDTETLAIVEGDNSSTLEKAIETFKFRHPSPVEPTTSDMSAFKAIASYITQRSSAIIATCVYTLWELRTESAELDAKTLPTGSTKQAAAAAEATLERTMVAFNGGVIEKYPGYLANCQGYVNDLMASRTGDVKRSIDLVEANESSLFGAAIALACVEAAGK